LRLGEGTFFYLSHVFHWIRALRLLETKMATAPRKKHGNSAVARVPEFRAARERSSEPPY
jgi:hypothetical protein